MRLNYFLQQNQDFSKSRNSTQTLLQNLDITPTLKLILLFLLKSDAVIKQYKLMRSDLQSQSHVYDSFQTESISIYMRNVKKQARLIQLNTPAKSTDLIIIASTKFNIPDERVILFYNGFRIDNFQLPINLTEKGIIHIIDKRNLQAEQIFVNFRSMGWNVPNFKLAISPNTTIKEIIGNYIAPKYNIEESRFFVVYIGKTLNYSNSLKQEYVQDGAQLIVIQHKTGKQAYQKQAFQYNASYHMESNKHQSTVNNCPVTYLTSTDALKKKSLQQAALINQQSQANLSMGAGPKPFPLPSFPVLNDSFLNNINISTIKPETAEAPVDSVAPIEKPVKKISSEVERSASLNEEKSGEPKVKILKGPAFQQKPKPQPKQYKPILQLESYYQQGNQHNISTDSGAFPFPFPPFSKQQSNQKDSFVDPKSTTPAPAAPE